MTTAFELASYRVAAEFLQTVVVVDNLAKFTPPDPAPVELTPPDEFDTAPVEPLPDAAEVVQPRQPDELDAGAISSAFASEGLVCGILRPTQADRQKEAVLKAARGADVVVLDWQMNDNGELATEIVKGLIEQDQAEDGRLRLIAIYTGFSPLKGISKALRTSFPTLKKTSGLTLEADHARVVFLAKDAAHNAPDENKEAVTEEALPGRLVTEFARFTGGLLPNATLASMAGLRRHTHRMLARFDKSMDGPLLSHRTLLPSSSEAEEYAADLIIAELQAQVPVHRIVSDYLGETSVRDYILHRYAKGATPALMLDTAGKIIHPLQADQVVALIESGVSTLAGDVPAMEQKVPLPQGVRKSYEDWLSETLFDRLYLLFAKNLREGRDEHFRFATRAKLKRGESSLKDGNNETLPTLRLGTVLVSDNQFWVCLTPLCDSMRLEPKDNRLLLAELEVDNRRFDLVVHDGNMYRRLRVVRKRTNISSYRFAFDDAGEVKAKFDAGKAIFESLDNGASGTGAVRFRWLGELKPMHAQRMIQAFTSNLARIGLDDFEWHRRQLPSN